MDKLEIAKAVFENMVSEKKKNIAGDEDPLVTGYGIGYARPRSIRPGKRENYAIVMHVSPAISDAELATMKKKIKVPKKDIPQFAEREDLPKMIVVRVRYEKKEFSLLGPPPPEVTPAPAAPAALAGGDPIFSNNVLIGTAGYVFVSGGISQLVSNKHVLGRAGMGNAVSNAGGVQLATVTTLSGTADSGMARLETGAVFSREIPGIGTPTAITPGLAINTKCKKRGASTAVTEFWIKWQGVHAGVPTIVGVHVNGATVPVVGSGDSGSVVIGNNTEIMGLVYAGATAIGQGPNGDLYSEIWAMDISHAFQDILLP